MIIIPKRGWRYPIAYEKSYNKTLRAYVARIIEECTKAIPEIKAVMEAAGARFDDYDSDLTALLDRIGARIDRRVAETAIRRRIEQIYGQVDRFNDADFRAIVGQAVGAKDFYVNENWQAVARSVFVQENLDLIKSIKSQTLEKIRYKMGDMVMQAQDNALQASELSDMIQDVAQNERNRADLIARDQIGKLNGRMAQFRQQSAGIDRYIWRTSHDERVRPSHQLRDGKEFEWAKPPPDGNPGIPIRCRCIAIPVIDTETLGMGSIEQQKNERKIDITDVAIDKLPRIQLKGFSATINDNVQTLTKELLLISKNINDSNEVGTMYNWVTGAQITRRGTISAVDMTDSGFLKMVQAAYAGEIIFIHNHPSGSTFSYADIGFLLQNDEIGVMVLVTNTGRMRTLQKTKKFSYNEAKKLLANIKENFGITGAVTGDYQQIIAEEFLDRAKEVGLTYERR